MPAPAASRVTTASLAPLGRPLSLPALRTRAGIRPIRLVHFCIVIMAAGNLGRLPALWVLGRDTPILPHEIVLLGTLLVAALACVQARALRVDGVIGAAAAFAVVGLGSAVATALRLGLGAADLLYALAYLARWLAYVALYVAIVNVGRGADAEALWTTVERTVLAFAAFGVVQALVIPGFAQRVFPTGGDTAGWDVQGHRLVSTLLDPNFAGAFIVLPLLVMLGRLSFGVPVRAWKPLLLITSVLLTASRSSILALIVGGGVIVLARGISRRLVRFAALALALTVPFVPLLVQFGQQYNKFGIDGSALLRLVAWLRALVVLSDYPVFGVGFNTYGYVQASYGWALIGRDGFGLDGGLLFIAVLTGAVGLTAYVAMLAAVVRRSRRLWRDSSAPLAVRGTALGVGAGVPAICVHSIFVNSILLPWIVAMLSVLWGIVYLMNRRQATARTLAGVGAAFA